MNLSIDKVLNNNRKKLNTKQAAEVVGVSEQTLTAWRCTKKEVVPYYKVGSRVFYFENELNDWLETKRVA